MVGVLSLFLIGVLFLFGFYYLIFKQKRQNYPKGPTPLPILGTIHITGAEPQKTSYELSKKYGPIVALKFGSADALIFHGTQLIKEAYGLAEFSGRYFLEANTFLLGDHNGILQASGKTWKEQRRFALRTLRDFGFGKSSMEDMILEEANEICDWLKKQNGSPVELQKRFGLAVVNSLWRILTGERFEHDDKELIEILEQLESTASTLLSFTSPLKIAILFFYPKVAKFFSKLSGWEALEKSCAPRMNLFKRIIEEHQNSFVSGSPRDFIDVYLEEINQTTDEDSSFHPKIGKQSLKSVMSDLFVAGSDTTSVTLTWAILYILHNPQVQKKLHDQIKTVIKDRVPSLKDRPSIPYMEAVIMETLRMSSIVPISVAHASTSDKNFNGFDIPSGTTLMANLHANHYDESIWGDPKVFRPERFINPDGSCMQRHEALMPFSTGKRVCLGENLARDSLFLFLTTIFQQFEILNPEGQKLPSLEPKLGQITLVPYSYKVVLKERT